MEPTIAPANRSQAEAWDGPEGGYWAIHHDAFEQSLAAYHGAFHAAAGIGATDRVLDVGCATGVTTRAAARAATRGNVTGVDLSTEMLAVGGRLAAEAGLDNITFLRADAQVHAFPPASFDVAVSLTGAMFFGDPHAAFTRLLESLRPGGRLVLLTWRSVELQEWAQCFSEALTGSRPPVPPPGAPGPFSLSDEDRVRNLLESAGFRDVRLTPHDEPTVYGRTVDEAHDLLLGLLGWMVRHQDAEQRQASSGALRRVLADHLDDHGVRFRSATWLITATRP